MAVKYVSATGDNSDGSTWAKAYTTIATAHAAMAAGDTCYIASTHVSETSLTVFTSPGTAAVPCHYWSVNPAGSVPPVTADITLGALFSSTNAASLAISGCFDAQGFTFRGGSGSSGISAITFGASGTDSVIYLNGCALIQNNTASTSTIDIGSTGTHTYDVTLDNTTVKFGAVGQSIRFRQGRLTWKNTTSAVDAAGSQPTNLFTAPSATSFYGIGVIEGVDLSYVGSGKNIVGAFAAAGVQLTFDMCKLNASVTRIATPTTDGHRIHFLRCNSGAVNYGEYRNGYRGSEDVSTTVVRTGGFTDGTQKKSRNVSTASTVLWATPFIGTPITIWNVTVGSSVNITVEGIWNGTVVPNNDEVWFEVRHMGSTLTPQASFASGTKVNGLSTTSATALTASTQVWTSNATAWASLHAYSLGDIIYSTNNTGRLFVCTTAGSTGVTEAVGFASAVDGDAVTDTTAVFRCMVRFKQTIAITPQMAGSIIVTPKVAKASRGVAGSGELFIDPYITLS